MHPGSPAAFSRRDFVRSAACAAGLGLLPATASRASTDGGGLHYIRICCTGGLDALSSTSIPLRGAVVDRLRTLRNGFRRDGGLVTDPADTLPLNEEFGLHKDLVPFHQAYQAGNLRIFTQIGAPNTDGSHAVAFAYTDDGNRYSQAGQTAGWIGRLLDEYPEFSSSNACGLLYHNYRMFHTKRIAKPLVLDSTNTFTIHGFGAPEDNAQVNAFTRSFLPRVQSRSALETDVAGQLQAGKRLASDFASLQGIPLTGTYRNFQGLDSPFFQSAALAAKILKSKVSKGDTSGTIMQLTTPGAFDTHSDQFRPVSPNTGWYALYPVFDRLMIDLAYGVNALITDIKAAGLWNRTVIEVYSEFGRTVHGNGSGGTDHGLAYSSMVLGGGIKGGIHGPSLTAGELDQGFRPVQHYSNPARTIVRRMGFDPGRLFTDTGPMVAEISDLFG